MSSPPGRLPDDLKTISQTALTRKALKEQLKKKLDDKLAKYQALVVIYDLVKQQWVAAGGSEAPVLAMKQELADLMVDIQFDQDASTQAAENFDDLING